MKRLAFGAIIVLAVVLGASYGGYRLWPKDRPEDASEDRPADGRPAGPEEPSPQGEAAPRSKPGDTYVVERTEYHAPPPPDDGLRDDRLEDKKPAFDETLVDSRPLTDADLGIGRRGAAPQPAWQVNASAAVVRLDCPMIRPDSDGDLLVLRPSCAEAVKAAKRRGMLLPSANLIDGAAKQFDDGLYAAVDLACYRGELGIAPAAPKVVRAMFDKLAAGSPARPFLAAALDLAGEPVELTAAEAESKKSLLAGFEGDQTRSKPISFYTWTPELKRVWRFYRFLQFQFGERELPVPRAVAGALDADPDLLGQYRAINGLYGRLTNPMVCLRVDALIGAKQGIKELAAGHHARRPRVAVFPPSTSRETELFEALFGVTGVSPEVNLMTELIRRVRSGEVDLAPSKECGWYQHQVYALETLLLPSKGREGEKLLLTAPYKRRLTEAFKAVVVKRRETHVRQLYPEEKPAEKPIELPEHVEIRPRLRVEPLATYYLRTARAYAFVQDLLTAAAGRERLAAMHGLKEGGQRGPGLAEELDAVRLRFYGFYLVACEDLGMRAELPADEPVDRQAAAKAALAWLGNVENDPDLACDTRASVPIFINRDASRPTTRLWATLGVRLARVETRYARPPSVRPWEQGGAWQEVKPHQLATTYLLIPVDESAEIELRGYRTLTREELRAACDRHKTKEAILAALAQ